jgi:hypothetical protein
MSKCESLPLKGKPLKIVPVVTRAYREKKFENEREGFLHERSIVERI